MKFLDELYVKELKVIHRSCLKCCIWKIHIKEKRRADPGGGTPIWNRRGCLSEILNLTPKGDHLGVA